MNGVLVAGIGESDCELLGDGWLAQPVNAVTSLAYVVVGVWILWRARRLVGERPTSAVFAVCVAAIGVGSVLYHGPQIAGSRALHDLPILVTVLFMVVHDLGALQRRRRPAWGLLVGLSTIGIAASLVVPDLGAVLTGVAVVALVVLEVLVFRAGVRPVDARRQLVASAVIVGVAAIGAASWLLGRTGSPACDPDGVVQLHGLWHVISSSVFGLWWWLAVGLPAAAASPDASRPAEARV